MKIHLLLTLFLAATAAASVKAFSSEEDELLFDDELEEEERFLRESKARPQWFYPYRRVFKGGAETPKLRACGFIKDPDNPPSTCKTSFKRNGGTGNYWCGLGEQTCPADKPASAAMGEMTIHPKMKCDCDTSTGKMTCTPWDPQCFSPKGTIDTCPTSRPDLSLSTGPSNLCKEALTCRYGKDDCCKEKKTRKGTFAECTCTPDEPFKCGKIRESKMCADVDCGEIEEVPTPTGGSETATVFSSPASYRSTGRELDVTLNLVSTDLAKSYKNERELAADLSEAFKFCAMNIIESEVGVYKGYSFSVCGGAPPIRAIPLQESFAFAQDDASVASAEQPATPPGPSAAGVDDFDTFNQEEGVDEADVIKANKDYVAVAYGDILGIYTAREGEWITNITMPPVKELKPEPIKPQPRDDFIAIDEPLLIDRPFTYKPKPRIRSLMMHGDRLVVVVEGYGVQFQRKDSAFTSYKSTHVRVYDMSYLQSSSELFLIHEEDINGNYRDARSIGKNVHIVTTTSLNWWTLITSKLRKWSNKEFSELSDDEYRKVAAAKAKDEVIPAAVKLVMEEITLHGLPDMFRIALYQDRAVDGSTDAEALIHDGSVFKSFVQISSFDVNDNARNLKISTSGAFTWSSWGFTYSSTDFLFFACQGWNWSPLLGGSAQTTYLLGFEINDNGTTSPRAMGSTPGQILNQYSMDEKDGFLRVGTTITTFWPWRLFNQPDQTIVRPESSTKNQFIIMKIPAKTEKLPMFKETGRINNLGLPDERFTAMRIFDDVAYAVTFVRTDPFYVLDIKDPYKPKVLGELKINGWSDQLMAMNDDKTLIAAIGQDADANGRRTGKFTISIFDAKVPTDPKLLHREIVGENNPGWASSSASFDVKALRLTPLPGTGVSLLTAPLRIYDYKNPSTNFDGYVVWNLSREGIQLRMEIPHVNPDNWNRCYYPAYLPDRSLIFDGKVSTFKSHSIITTDLDTAKTTWELEMPKPTDKNLCTPWFEPLLLF